MHLCVHSWDTATVITNMDPQQVNLWYEVPHPKLLVYTWEGGYQPDASETVLKIQNAIANAFSIPEPDVGPPLALAPPTRKYSAPWCFLVANIPLLAAEALLKKQCWSTPSISFFAIPFAPRPSPYICTIANLTFPESKASQVLNLIKNTVLASKKVEACISLDDPDPRGRGCACGSN
jgi:hypothetical protein